MKIAIGAVIVIIVLGGAWYFLSRPAASPNGYGTPTGTQTDSNVSAGASTNLSSGSSNANLDTDLNQVNTQIQGASNDSASVNQSLNDQPVPQSE